MKPKKPKKRLELQLDTELYEAFRKSANSRGATVSEMVRKLMRKLVKYESDRTA